MIETIRVAESQIARGGVGQDITIKTLRGSAEHQALSNIFDTREDCMLEIIDGSGGRRKFKARLLSYCGYEQSREFGARIIKTP